MDLASLSKLNVAQLKSKCKELKISGYSKLSKQLLIEKILASTTLPNNEGAAVSLHVGAEPSAGDTPKELTIQAGSGQINAPSAVERAKRATQPTEANSSGKKTRAKDNGTGQPAAKKQKKTAGGKDKANDMTTCEQREPPSAGEGSSHSAAHQPSSATTEPCTGPRRSTHMLGRPDTSTSKASGSTNTVLPLTDPRPIPNAGQPPSVLAHGPVLEPVPCSRLKQPAETRQTPPKPPRLQENTSLPIPSLDSSRKSADTLAPTIPSRRPQLYKPTTFKAPTIIRPPRISSHKYPTAEPHNKSDQQIVPTVPDKSLDFPPPPPCTSFPRISIPPSMARRRVAERMSVVFSGISDPSVLALCVRVSRAWRYAVYLSATHTLMRDFPGKRLEAVQACIKEPRMTSMWAYLRGRQQEAIVRYETFQQSWLGRFFGSHGAARETLGIKHEPLSWRMWTSPDDEQQSTVALRFVSTRVVFALARRHEDSTPVCKWVDATVIGAEEVIPNEVWRITTTRSPDRAEATNRIIVESFHVLFDTGEVIGHAPTPPARTSGTILLGRRVTRGRHIEVFDEPLLTGSALRVDWTRYIRVCQLGGVPSLQDAITSGDQESYVAGVSSFWLRTLARNPDSQNNELLKTIGRRYVLACVEPNSVSGEYRDVIGMTREVAGLGAAERSAFGNRQQVGLYISGHHLVESVHLTSTHQGREIKLHPALALVLTAPGREYFVLRDTGVPIGTSDEGLEPLWQKLIGCDAWGSTVTHMRAVL